jgi:transcriptional regulator NrdR
VPDRCRGLRDLRRQVQMVFQDPYASINPRLKAGTIVGEPIENYENISAAARAERVGQLLERADKTTRILDVRYQSLPERGVPERISPDEALEWSAVLRSCSAWDAYKTIHGGDVHPSSVAEFLLLSDVFPRSVRYCVNELNLALRNISGVSTGRFTNDAEKLTGRFLAELQFSTIEEIVREGLAVVKRNGAREEFDMGKIAAGIRKATDKRPIEVERINLLISEVVEGLQAKFEDEVPSSAIGEEIMAKLQGVDQIAYVRYASVYREFRDIEELAKAIEQLRKGGKAK